MKFALTAIVFALWNAGAYAAHRHILRQRIEAAWSVGHKLGRASCLVGKDRVDQWLTEAGIDPNVLPPVK